MSAPVDSFHDVVLQIQQIRTLREAVPNHGLYVLEQREPALAELLVKHFGSRKKAARWMCIPQRAFDGRCAYDVLAGGDVERVRDRIASHVRGDALLHLRQG